MFNLRPYSSKINLPKAISHGTISSQYMQCTVVYPRTCQNRGWNDAGKAVNLIYSNDYKVNRSFLGVKYGELVRSVG